MIRIRVTETNTDMPDEMDFSVLASWDYTSKRYKEIMKAIAKELTFEKQTVEEMFTEDNHISDIRTDFEDMVDDKVTYIYKKMKG
jgi:hypothetical protein